MFSSLLLSSVQSNDLAETLTCFMYKNRCYAKLDFFSTSNVSITVEIHSPEQVPVYDSSPVIQVNTATEVTYIYKVTETLYV